MSSTGRRLGEAVARVEEAAEAKKCWPCECLHSSLDAIERAFPGEERPKVLEDAVDLARSRLETIKYDCLGCDVCFPAIAMNTLNVGVEACPTGAVQDRGGWPPLPGSYSTLRYHAPVAVCTLTDTGLASKIAAMASGDLAIVGTLQTENLGIERLIRNTIANPNIRFLILCGADSRQTIGHLPGQSLAALGRSGVDKRMRINGAEGKRPRLRNIDRQMVEHFRQSVEILDYVGQEDAESVLEFAREAAKRDPGPTIPITPEDLVSAIPGCLPKSMVSDPAGYFVIYLDRERALLTLEHFRNDGALDVIIESGTAAEVYSTAIAQNLLTRLDHAAYLGRELTRAERALENGDLYVQDRAPERQSIPTPGCGCDSGSGDPT